jgi:UDP-N-acetyl-D-galactosamine dehydrogenase
VAVIGLGYVGLPVAVGFAREFPGTVGFDIDQSRITELRAHQDRTREFEPAELAASSLTVSHDPSVLADATFYIITVPTPIDDDRRPDLGALRAASRSVAPHLKRGDIVVYESTVYPGATEEVCGPILEAGSGLKAGVDFSLGYSPERINPGDREHRLESITKVVSGDTPSRSPASPQPTAPWCTPASTRRPASRWPRPPRSSRTRSATSTSRS